MTICTVTIFSFRNDSPLIPTSLHSCATKEIDNTSNQADPRSARHIPFLERKEEKDTKSQKLCNTKIDNTSPLMGCQHVRRDMLIFSVSLQNTDKQRKETRAIQMLTHVHQVPTVDGTAGTPRTRVSRGSRRISTVTLKTGVLVKTVNHMKRSSHPSQT